MTTKEIRDRLMMEKVKNQNAVAAVERACTKIKQIQTEIKAEDVEYLESQGISLNPVLKLNLERCKSDEIYLETSKREIELLVNKLHEFLEGELNV